MRSENTDQADEEIGMRELLTTVWEGRWWVLASIMICGGIAVAYALLATPVYRAEALVQIRQEPRGEGLSVLAAQFGGLVDFSGLAEGGGGGRALTIATLQSRVVVQSFIQDYKLLPELFESKWDSYGKRWNVSDPAEEPGLWHGYKVFSTDILSVSEDKKTGLVTVAVEWSDPVLAAAWATELIARTNTYLRDKTILESEKHLDYLRNQIRQTGVIELQQAVYTLVESELKKLMLAKGGDEYAIKTIDPAQPPKTRSRPQPVRIAMIGILLGAIIGITAAFIRGSFSSRATKTRA